MDARARRRAEAHLEPNRETTRDLFGKCRGECLRCGAACAGGYLKRTNEYARDASSAGETRAHPHNDLTLTNCSRCGCASAEHAVDENADWRERGNDAFDDGRFERAVGHYTRAIECRAGDAKSYSNRSACFLKMGKYSQALSDAERAVDIDGHYAKARTRVGAAALAMGNTDVAKRSFELALKLDPTSQTARDGLKACERSRAPRTKPAPTKPAGPPTATPSPAPADFEDTDSVCLTIKQSIEEAKSLLSRLERVMRDIRVEVATCERLGPVKTAIRNVDSEVSMKHAATSTVGVSMPMSNRREKEEEEEEEGEESSLMSRLLRVVAGEDTDEQDDDLRMADSMNMFKAFEREHADSVTDAAEVEDADELWAERWEEEQFARQQQRNAEKIVLAGATKRRATEVKMIKPPGLKVDSLADLLKVKEPCGEMGDADAEGVLRGPCKICDKACTSFAKFSSWKRAPLPNHDANNEEYTALYNAVVLARDGTRCARCGCESSNHCNEKEFRKRERLERIEKTRKEDEACARRHRVRLLGERVQIALEREETVCESTCDAVSGAERVGCQTCTECPGFKLVFPQTEANNPEIVCFCSICGCRASDHSVCKDWAREREASRARFEHEQRERQRERSQRVFEIQRERNVQVEHYKTLGVAVNASKQEIAKAYRRAALLWHPDKHTHKAESERKSATRMFIRVSEAFKAIGDLP